MHVLPTFVLLHSVVTQHVSAMRGEPHFQAASSTTAPPSMQELHQTNLRPQFTSPYEKLLATALFGYQKEAGMAEGGTHTIVDGWTAGRDAVQKDAARRGSVWLPGDENAHQGNTRKVPAVLQDQRLQMAGAGSARQPRRPVLGELFLQHQSFGSPGSSAFPAGPQTPMLHISDLASIGWTNPFAGSSSASSSSTRSSSSRRGPGEADSSRLYAPILHRNMQPVEEKHAMERDEDRRTARESKRAQIRDPSSVSRLPGKMTTELYSTSPEAQDYEHLHGARVGRLRPGIDYTTTCKRVNNHVVDASCGVVATVCEERGTVQVYDSGNVAEHHITVGVRGNVDGNRRPEDRVRVVAAPPQQIEIPSAVPGSRKTNTCVAFQKSSTSEAWEKQQSQWQQPLLAGKKRKADALEKNPEKFVRGMLAEEKRHEEKQAEVDGVTAALQKVRVEDVEDEQKAQEKTTETVDESTLCADFELQQISSYGDRARRVQEHHAASSSATGSGSGSSRRPKKTLPEQTRFENLTPLPAYVAIGVKHESYTVDRPADDQSKTETRSTSYTGAAASTSSAASSGQSAEAGGGDETARGTTTTSNKKLVRVYPPPCVEVWHIPHGARRIVTIEMDHEHGGVPLPSDCPHPNRFATVRAVDWRDDLLFCGTDCGLFKAVDCQAGKKLFEMSILSRDGKRSGVHSIARDNAAGNLVAVGVGNRSEGNVLIFDKRKGFAVPVASLRADGGLDRDTKHTAMVTSLCWGPGTGGALSGFTDDLGDEGEDQDVAQGEFLTSGHQVLCSGDADGNILHWRPFASQVDGKSGKVLKKVRPLLRRGYATPRQKSEERNEHALPITGLAFCNLRDNAEFPKDLAVATQGKGVFFIDTDQAALDAFDEGCEFWHRRADMEQRKSGIDPRSLGNEVTTGFPQEDEKTYYHTASTYRTAFSDKGAGTRPSTRNADQRFQPLNGLKQVMWPNGGCSETVMGLVQTSARCWTTKEDAERGMKKAAQSTAADASGTAAEAPKSKKVLAQHPVLLTVGSAHDTEGRENIMTTWKMTKIAPPLSNGAVEGPLKKFKSTTII